MKLERFRVINFRSVADSGWIDVGEITAFLGENESGKTDVLLPLWKLNPAGPKIYPLSDYPKALFNDIRNQNPKPVFIETEFSLSDEAAENIARLANSTREQVQLVRVSRRYDEQHVVTFPKAVGIDAVSGAAAAAELEKAQAELAALALENDVHLAVRDSAVGRIADSLQRIYKNEGAVVTLDDLKDMRSAVAATSAGDVAASEASTKARSQLDSRLQALQKIRFPLGPPTGPRTLYRRDHRFGARTG